MYLSLYFCHVYAPPEVDQVGLLVSKEVDKELVLEGGEGDLDGGPGQVAHHLQDHQDRDILINLVKLHGWSKVGGLWISSFVL